MYNEVIRLTKAGKKKPYTNFIIIPVEREKSVKIFNLGSQVVREYKLSFSLSGGFGLVNLKNRAILAGGSFSRNAFNQFLPQFYHSSNLVVEFKWKGKSSFLRQMNQDRNFFPLCCSQSSIFALGGTSQFTNNAGRSAFKILNHTELYCAKRNIWREQACLKVPKRGMGACFVKKFCYAFYGYAQIARDSHTVQFLQLDQLRPRWQQLEMDRQFQYQFSCDALELLGQNSILLFSNYSQTSFEMSVDKEGRVKINHEAKFTYDYSYQMFKRFEEPVCVYKYCAIGKEVIRTYRNNKWKRSILK